MLEQEIASIIQFILNKAGNPSPYYDEVPEGFLVPSVYFPAPEITSKGDTLTTYALSYIWFIKFFHKDTPLAHSLGLTALTALQGNRNRIPLIDEKGVKTGRLFHIKDSELKKIEGARGVTQLTVSWDSTRLYNNPEAEKMMGYDIDMYTREAYQDVIQHLKQ